VHDFFGKCLCSTGCKHRRSFLWTRSIPSALNGREGRFEGNNQIEIIMATNRIDCLDPALLRPGRIDMKIESPNPGDAGRLQILRIHSRIMNMQRGLI
jgi:26S proteasome regulatory subunit T6